MKQLQLSDRQSSFIFYLVHQGKGRTEAARLAGFAAPRQSAFTLTQSPKIIAKIRQERNKVYQTELASTAVQTLKEVMRVSDCEELVGKDIRNDNHLTAYPTYFNFLIDALYNM